MRKIVLGLMFCLLCTWGVCAQDTRDNQKISEKQRSQQVKKVLGQTKTALKTGKDLPGTENSLRKLLVDSVNNEDVRIHLALFETLKKQYEQGNEKLFLKQNYDTASLFNIAERMFIALNRLDSIDAMPDKSGKVSLKYRKSHASYLTPYHVNLYVGGLFFMNHKKYVESMECLDTYLTSPGWPLFSGSNMSVDSLRVYHAAYAYLQSGYLNKDYDGALKYLEYSLLHKPRRETALLYVAESYLHLNDYVNYVKYLQEGISAYPKSMYFFSRLVDYYSEKGMFENALAVTDSVIKNDSVNLIYRKTRQTILLNLKRYDDCIAQGKNIISDNDSIADVYYNVALAYYNKALDIQNASNIKSRDKSKKTIMLYKECRPYMEKYREMAPDRKDRWRSVLYTIYLNLNMGKEFSEIESLE